MVELGNQRMVEPYRPGLPAKEVSATRMVTKKVKIYSNFFIKFLTNYEDAYSSGKCEHYLKFRIRSLRKDYRTLLRNATNYMQIGC